LVVALGGMQNWPRSQTIPGKPEGWPAFALRWSHHVRLLSVADAEARRFCEREAVGADHGRTSLWELR
jgi:hypothetical protein